MNEKSIIPPPPPPPPPPKAHYTTHAPGIPENEFSRLDISSFYFSGY